MRLSRGVNTQRTCDCGRTWGDGDRFCAGCGVARTVPQPRKETPQARSGGAALSRDFLRSLETLSIARDTEKDEKKFHKRWVCDDCGTENEGDLASWGWTGCVSCGKPAEIDRVRVLNAEEPAEGVGEDDKWGISIERRTRWFCGSPECGKQNEGNLKSWGWSECRSCHRAAAEDGGPKDHRILSVPNQGPGWTFESARPPARGSTPAADTLAVGKRVRLSGFGADTGLNGKTADIIKHNDRADRWVVKLFDDSLQLVRADNLQIV